MMYSLNIECHVNFMNLQMSVSFKSLVSSVINSRAIDNNVIAHLEIHWETFRTYFSRVLYLQMAMFKLYGDLRKGEISGIRIYCT